MEALIPLRYRRTTVLAIVALALAAGGAHAGGRHAGGVAIGRPVVVVPVHAPHHRVHPHWGSAPFHPGSPGLAATIIRPAVPPVLFSPIVPGFVTFTPPVVIVAPVAAPIHHPHPVPLPAPVWVQPQVPVVAPSSPLFFAPPVQTVVAPAGGQVLIIRRTGH
jgi:hypothetical protein